MAIEISGELTTERLDEIFSILLEGENACSLLVSDGVSEKIFYFSIGGIRMVSLGGRKGVPIIELLIQQGKLVPEERDQILEHAKNRGKRAGEAAQELGFVTKEEVEAGVRTQLESELCDLFMWDDAEFEFREGQPPPQFYEGGHRAASITCDVPEFLKSVRRRRETWNSIRARIPTSRELFRTTGEGRANWQSEAGDPLSRTFGLIDGKRRVRDIQESVGLSPFQTHEALYELLKKGWIEKVAGEESERDPAHDRDRVLEEIQKLERARTEMVGDLIVRTRLAKAYEQISDNLKAAQVWKEIARIHRRNNDLKQTFTALQFAVRCVPEDFNTREQILEIYRAQGMVGKLLGEGRVVAEMLFKNNLLNRARNLLGNLVRLAPQDEKIRKLYALTLLGLGERSLALQELKELAAILERKGGDQAELKEIYRRILALDRKGRVWRKKLFALNGSPKLVWITRGAFAAAILFVVVGGGSFFYEFVARAEFKEEGLAIETLLQESNFKEARQKTRDLAGRFPLSSLNRDLDERLRRIDEAEAAYIRYRLPTELRRAKKLQGEGYYDEAQAIYDRVSTASREKRESVQDAQREIGKLIAAEEEAGRLVLEGNRLVHEGKFESAHRIFGNVQSLFPGTVAARTIRYPVEISSVPPGARVFVNGEESSQDFTYSIAGPTRIRLELNGYQPYEFDVEDVLEPRVLIHLRREVAWVFTGEGPFDASPVVAGDNLYVVGRDRNLYALSLEDGGIVFKTSLGIFGDTTSCVAVVGDRVVVGTSRGEVLGIDSTEGSILWRKKVGPSIRADLVRAPDGELVYLTEGTGRVLALRAADGEVIWTHDAGASATSAPVLDDEHLYVGSIDRCRLAALRLTDGSEAWSVPVRAGVAGTPSVAGSIVSFGCDDFCIYTVDPNRKNKTESFRTGGKVIATPTLDGQTLFAASTDGAVYCYRTVRKRDKLKWRAILGDGEELVAAPVLTSDRIYVSSTNGYLYALDRISGSTRWAFKTDGPIRCRPVIAGDMIYLASGDGRIYAIKK